ncbi:crooked neck-like protein 1 [Silurus asotus]|uniref:Crooked neck-like protein 1 n=1 Tax=Silurus asotus TaxID=30991 RepID=A0AAD5FBF2_SILAS|nr:crooked neck-like protein 1 [Silurus asotus]
MNSEQEFGTSADMDLKLMPKQVDTGWEEYYDYIFLKDAANQPNLKLLSMAKMWKKQQQQDQDQEKQDAEKDQSTEPTQPRDEQEETMFYIVHYIVSITQLDPKNWIKYARFEDARLQCSREKSVKETLEALHLPVDQLRSLRGAGSQEPAGNAGGRAATGITSMTFQNRQPFIFAKIWLLYANFKIRQKNLKNARRCLGTSFGKCQKNKLFKGYIMLELKLMEFNRCRKLYEKFIVYCLENYTTWINFTRLEMSLGETARARAIYDLSISQPRLDMPEVLPTCCVLSTVLNFTYTFLCF